MSVFFYGCITMDGYLADKNRMATDSQSAMESVIIEMGEMLSG